MPIYNSQKHRKRLYYQKEEYPAIKIYRFNPQEIFSISICNSMLIFIMEGSLIFNRDSDDGSEINAVKGDFMIVKSDWTAMVNSVLGCVVVAFSMLKIESLRDLHIMDNVYLKQMPLQLSRPTAPLKINTPLWNYLRSLYTPLSDGLICHKYYEIKTKELLFILRAYYPPEQLYVLFNPQGGHDSLFSDYVRANWNNYKTVTQLAQSMNLSYGAFARRFVKVFSKAPQQWILDQKAEAIYFELTQNIKHPKQIAIDFGFLSPSQFNEFCKDRWGKTACSIRRNP